MSNTTVIKFKSGDRRIPNTLVREGGGVGWMLNPIPMPNFVGSDCDDMRGHPCGGCPCGSKYPGGNVPEGVCVDDVCYGKNPLGKSNMGKNTAIEDEVRVPAHLPAGEYVSDDVTRCHGAVLSVSADALNGASVCTTGGGLQVGLRDQQPGSAHLTSWACAVHALCMLCACSVLLLLPADHRVCTGQRAESAILACLPRAARWTWLADLIPLSMSVVAAGVDFLW